MKRTISIMLACLLAGSVMAMAGCSKPAEPSEPPAGTTEPEDGPEAPESGIFQNEATVLIDGQPVFINFDTNLLDPNYTLRNPFEFKTTLDHGNDHKVVLYADTVLYDVNIVTVSTGDPGSYYIEDVMHTVPELTQDDYLVFSTMVPGSAPAEAITFTDKNGDQHSYLLLYDELGGVTCTTEVELKTK